MRCPYQEVKYTTTTHDGEEYTRESREFGYCLYKLCPYFGVLGNKGWCRKVAKETKFTEYCEVK